MRLSKICMALATLSFVPSVLANDVYQEDFSTGLNGFTAVSVKNDAPHNWQLIASEGYVSLDGHGFDFGTATAESDDWLISPKLDISATVAPSFSFNSRLQYNGRNIEAYVLTDYTGDLETATKTKLDIPTLPDDMGFSGAFSDWTDSGTMDLSAFQGQQVHVAIRFIATAEQVADADYNVAQWEINDVSVQGATKSLPTFTEDFSDGLGDITAVSVKSDAPHNWSTFANHDESGTQLEYVTLDGHGFDFSTATVESDDWLITPALTVSQSDEAAFSFDSRLQYFGRNLSVWISTDYDGSDPTAATWTELTIPNLPADPGWSGEFSAWTNSGAISLTDYQGQDVHLAVRYIADADALTDPDANVGQWEVDNIMVKGAYSTFKEEFTEGLGRIEAISLKSDAPHNWSNYANHDESGQLLSYVTLDGHGFDFSTATVESDDWLVTPSIIVEQTDEAYFSFDSRLQYFGRNLSAWISTDFDGDVSTATWTELTIPSLPADPGWSGEFSEWTNSGEISLAPYQNQEVVLAVRYLATADDVADADASIGQWEVDNITINGGIAPISFEPIFPQTAINFTVTPPPEGGVVGAELTFSATAVSNVVEESEYDYHWDFGNGDTAAGQTVNYTYETAGTYTPTLTVTYAGGELIQLTSDGNEVIVQILPEELQREGDAIVVTVAYVDEPSENTEQDDDSDDEILGLTFSWPLFILGLLGLRRRAKKLQLRKAD
ncbi:MAG: PKD domain-containing protein [Gammaproteobacteria bacterium]|nr:PKD domain-containing protein [Gammaproteobacteria bacterium]